MPKIDGYELCRYIKESRPLRDIPVLMISGKSNLDKLEKAFAEGAMDFISKPIQEKGVEK
jgi:PleD family two-component response regulator